MIIKTQFGVGDTVYFIEYTLKREMATCPMCEGEGVITISAKKSMTCPVCDGKKQIVTQGKREWRVTEARPNGCDTVRRIEIFVEPGVVNGGEEINYAFQMSYRRVPERDCFATLEEAQLECLYRNDPLPQQ